MSRQVGRSPSGITIGTASGGTLAALLRGNNASLAFPEDLPTSEITLQMLNISDDAADCRPWFASILREIPESLPWASLLKAATHGRGWWPSLLASMATKAYRHNDWSQAGLSPFFAQVAAMNASAVPVKVRPRDGSAPLEDAANKLLGAEVDMRKGMLQLMSRNFSQSMGTVEAAAASSAFWASEILADRGGSGFGLRLKEHMLDRVKLGDNDFYLADGGLVEPTGILVLLRRQIKRIVVFYNCPEDLRTENAVLGFLFGASGRTDFGNVWPGKTLLQVFGHHHWPEVHVNLTSDAVSAHLFDLEVRANGYLGIEPYRIEELLILGNHRSETFLDSFPAPDHLRLQIRRQWPLDMPMGMSPIEANLLCAFSGWKVTQNQAALGRILGPRRVLGITGLRS